MALIWNFLFFLASFGLHAQTKDEKALYFQAKKLEKTGRFSHARKIYLDLAEKIFPNEQSLAMEKANSGDFSGDENFPKMFKGLWANICVASYKSYLAKKDNLDSTMNDLRVCEVVGASPKLIKKIIERIEASELEADGSSSKLSWHVSGSYLFWQDSEVIESAGEKLELISNSRAPCVGAGLRRNGGNQIHELGICFYKGISIMGDKSNDGSYVNSGAPTHGALAHFGWRKKFSVNGVSAGLSLPLFFRSVDLSENEISREASTMFTYGLGADLRLVAGNWELQSAVFKFVGLNSTAFQAGVAYLWQ